MKLVKLILGFVFMLCLSLSLNSCGGHSHEGGDHDHGSEQTEATSDSHEEHDGHDHDGHDHDGSEEEGHDHDGTEAAHGEGAAFTSAYVCPMHCKGSGSETAGTCPVCNMDYVALEEHIKDGHDHNE